MTVAWAARPPSRVMRICIVLVHYFTPDLLENCISSILRTPRVPTEELSIIVVDNGSTAADQPRLAALPVKLLRPGANLGYAAAINLATANQEADVYLFMNPDMEVQDGCLARLAQVAWATGGVAAPRLYLDQACHFALPPTDIRTLPSELLRALSRSSRKPEGLARSRWRRHARCHIAAEQPISSYCLSGALLAVSATAFKRIGRFDEAYKLYYEETDWLQRARRIGVPATYVIDATAVHFYNRSAAQEPQALTWFLASERVFRRRHYGWLALQLLALVERLGRRRGAKPAPPLAALELPAHLGLGRSSDELWLELSRAPSGFPAASARTTRRDLAARFQEAMLLAQSLGQGDCRLAVTDRLGRELWSAGASVAAAVETTP